MIRKQSMNLQTGTKSMQALKRQYEQNKAKNKIIRREQRTAEKEHRRREGGWPCSIQLLHISLLSRGNEGAIRPFCYNFPGNVK